MKKIAPLLAIMMAILVSPMVQAVDVGDAQLMLVRQNCVQAQKTLVQVQQIDKVARINRGRTYESLIKLLVALNSRVALNTLSVPALTDTTVVFESEFTNFKIDYTAYELLTQEAQTIRCIERPQAFYDQLQLVREKRQVLATHIQTMDNILNVYDEGLRNLQQQVTAQKAPSSGVNP